MTTYIIYDEEEEKEIDEEKEIMDLKEK